MGVMGSGRKILSLPIIFGVICHHDLSLWILSSIPWPRALVRFLCCKVTLSPMRDVLFGRSHSVQPTWKSWELFSISWGQSVYIRDLEFFRAENLSLLPYVYLLNHLFTPTWIQGHFNLHLGLQSKTPWFFFFLSLRLSQCCRGELVRLNAMAIG